jgi:DNA-binding NarL/FixJ family response regulator
MIRVRIDISQPFTRAVLTRYLAGDGEIEVIPAGDEGEPPDVVIATVDGDGEWDAMLEQSGTAEVLLLADDLLPQDSEDAWRHGIRGILPLNIDRDVLIPAVKAVAVGLTVVPSRFAETMFPTRAGGASRGEYAESLTSREKEVLELLAEGLPNKVIAERLGISDHTAKFHVASILGKLGAASRTEAVTLAIRQGIIMV